jgi:hypothetical protein
MARPTSNAYARVFCALAAACALLLGVAGCGTRAANSPGSTSATTTGPASEAAKKEYEDAVTAALEPVISASQNLANQAPTIATPKDLAPILETNAGVYETAATELEGITPPAEVEALHQRLVEASQEFSAATTSAQKAAAKGDKKGIAPYAKAGARYQKELTDLQSEFSAKGYEFGTEATVTETTPTTPPATSPSTTPTTPTTTPTVPVQPTTPDAKGLQAPNDNSQKGAAQGKTPGSSKD